MTTQVIFKLDKKLKNQAMKKAEDEGVSLSSVLKMATKAFVDGDLRLGLVQEEKFNEKTRKEMDQIMKDIKAGKNLSPKFSSVKEMIEHLES